jgi:hypothetical protein
VEEVIRESVMPVVDSDDLIKIVKNEEPGEPKTRAPERIRDPGIHVVIIPGGRVISDDRRPLIIIVVIDRVRV